MTIRLFATLAVLSLLNSCAIYDGEGPPGVRIKVGESAEIVERKITLISVDASSAKVTVGASRRIRELKVGHSEPVDFTRGLVLDKVDHTTQSARIFGFRITRTLNPYQPF